MSKKTLHRMIEDNAQEEAIFECIKTTKDINKKDKNGNTPLHCLLKNYDIKIKIKMVQALVAAGANVNATNEYEETPLQLACDNGKADELEIVQTLLKAGADATAVDKWGNSALHLAVKHARDFAEFRIGIREDDIYRALIEAGADVNARNNQGATPIFDCRVKDIRTLVAAGANVNATDNDGNTPLHKACMEKDSARISTLLAEGADSEIKNKAGEKPAIKRWGIDTQSMSIHELIDDGVPVQDIIAAIAAGADVDEKKDYYTPLQQVVKKKLGSELVQALIDAGADVNAYATKDDLTDEDREGIEEGEYEEYEVYNGAEYAALFEASATNQLDIMKMLIDAGADVNLICGNGPYDTYPALSRAQTKEAIELLILNGAEVNMVYGDGEGTCTVLGDKVENSNISPECVLTLLKAGAASVAQTSYPELIDYYLQKHSDADEKLLAQIRTLWEKNNVEKQEELEEEFERNRRRNMENDWDDDDGWGDDDDDGWGDDEEEEETKGLSLHELIENAACVEEIEAAIAAGADVNARDEAGVTPLHKAAKNTRLGERCVRILLEAGADVNAKANNGETPLHVASGNCNTEASKSIVRLLLEVGADVNAKNEEKYTPLHLAVKKCDDEGFIRELLEAGADVNARDEDDRTPLHFSKGCHVRALLEAGADVNARDKWNQTPLHYMWDDKFVKILINVGADVNAKDEEGDTPLLRAARMSDDEGFIRALLEAGADVHAKDSDGRTPLHIAVFKCKNEGFIRALLEAGADVHARDKWNQTPLHHMRDDKFVKILIDAGADVNAKDEEGNTSLHSAAWESENTEEIGLILLEAGAAVNAKNEKKRTPLHIAVERSKDEGFIRALLEAGADVNARDEDDKTPLHLSKSCHVRALLKAGADVNARDRDNKTPLDLAQKESIREVLEKAMARAAAKKKKK